MSSDIRSWLIARRDALIIERDHIQPRIDHLNLLIAEATDPAQPVYSGGTMVGPLAKPAKPAKPPKSNSESQRGRHPKKSNSKVSTTDLVTMALKDAAPAGLTGREIAAVTATPIGTASSRASLMARDGMVRYEADSHRYFALHSEREDNNLQ